MASHSDIATPEAVETHSVRAELTTDAGPGIWRIGLIVLSNDYTVERDFMNMRPSPDVAIFTTRIVNTPDCTVATLRQMAPRITAATELLVPEGRLDAVAYACTSGSVVIGYDAIRDRIRAARPMWPASRRLPPRSRRWTGSARSGSRY